MDTASKLAKVERIRAAMAAVYDRLQVRAAPPHLHARPLAALSSPLAVRREIGPTAWNLLG
jgi:hypothetical protein